MLTYNLSEEEGRNLYEALYVCLKRDITSGVLEADTHLPSKREFASRLGVSVITVEHAYQQLIAEGYVRAELRRGYFVNDLGPNQPVPVPTRSRVSWDEPDGGEVERAGEREGAGEEAGDAADGDGGGNGVGGGIEYDFTGAGMLPGSFPYRDWQAALQDVLASRDDGQILASSPAKGLPVLRQVIADHIRESRGIHVSPGQIVVGAGAQFLYGLLAQLVSRDSVVALEDPGYPRLAKVYRSVGLASCHVPLDSQGISISALEESGANLVHVMPSHHFPTGIVMPVSRRYELLGWASAGEDRYIIEDDYDCEFRYVGKPIPALQGIDVMGKVVYMNTFTKTLAPGMRIGYMVLPPLLARRFDVELGFYSCTVPNIDQLALARLIREGRFDRQVSRIRRLHREGREAALSVLSDHGLGKWAYGQDAGLHFVLRVPHAQPGDAALLCERLRGRGVAVRSLSEYATEAQVGEALIINHASLPKDAIVAGMQVVAEEVQGIREA